MTKQKIKYSYSLEIFKGLHNIWIKKKNQKNRKFLQEYESENDTSEPMGFSYIFLRS